MKKQSMLQAALASALLLAPWTARALPLSGDVPNFSSDLEGLRAVMERLVPSWAWEALDPQRGQERFALEEFSSDQVERLMRLPTRESGIPEVLQGLWWMDGNPLPDKVISFGGSDWDAARRQTRIRVFGEGVWTWHPDLAGRSAYEFARRTRLTYEIQFNDDLTFGTITPIFFLGGRELRAPQSLVKFTVRFISDGLWLRESSFFGRLSHAYALRRIVGEDGQRVEPAYQQYLEAAPQTSLVARELP